jgi:hypothetical protein
MAKRSIYSLNILFSGGNGDERIDEAIDFLVNGRVPPGQSPAKIARKYAGLRAEKRPMCLLTKDCLYRMLPCAVERVAIGQEETAPVPAPFEWDPDDE